MRTKQRRWIGVDGEGVGRDPHRYVLLACSDGDSIESRFGLSTERCLKFLLDLGTRDARVCGYYLSYDWTKILRDLEDSQLHLLFRPELRARSHGAFSRVTYKQYQLHWLAGAMWINDGQRKVTVWDLGKYYQGPFCNVTPDGKLVGCLPDWNIRPDVQARIASMKQKRSAFTWRDMSKIRRYCVDECEALAEFATKLEQAHTDANLKPRGWFGPGSTASALLNRYDIREQRGVVPPRLVGPVACAFYGGRAEISRNGFVQGPIWGDDISSAYPHHASLLPCLIHGRWEKVTSERKLRSRGVVHALVRGHIENAKGAWAPLPVRLKNGTIVYPRSGASGWWWRDEWIAARQGWNGLRFDHAYVLRRECKCKPFGFMPALFAHRRAVGKETGEGKIIKLALNSVYGKLAQTIGGAQFASRVWAGMITSGTRAQVLRRMLMHRRLDSVLMIATDGLFTTEQIEADQEIVLGGWEQAEYPSITLVRPGIYWLGETKLRARGLGRDSLDVAKQQLALALDNRDNEVELAPRVTFGGAKLCVRAGSEAGQFTRSRHYGEWHQIPTHVSLSPTPKRNDDWSTHTLCDVDAAPYGTRASLLTSEHYEILELIREFMHYA